MWSGWLFSTVQCTSILLAYTYWPGLYNICPNLSCLPPFCLPEPVLVWSCGLFVLITRRNKDGAETKEGFSTIISASQENKLTSIRGYVSFFFSVSLPLSQLLNLFLIIYFCIVEWQEALHYFKMVFNQRSMGRYVTLIGKKTLKIHKTSILPT